MTYPAGADSWFDLAAYLLVAVPGIVASVLAWRIKVSAAATEEQVSNDHTSNLREDIDEIRAAVAEMHRDQNRKLDEHSVTLVEVERAVGRIGSEQRADRTQVQEIARDLYASVQRQERIVSKYHPDDARD